MFVTPDTLGPVTREVHDIICLDYHAQNNIRLIRDRHKQNPRQCNMNKSTWTSNDANLAEATDDGREKSSAIIATDMKKLSKDFIPGPQDAICSRGKAGNGFNM